MGIRDHSKVILLCVMVLAPLVACADTAADQRTSLQAQLNQVQFEIRQNQTQLSNQQKQRVSLERDVSILDSKINAARLQIKQRDLTIAQLKGGIVDKERGIKALDGDVATGQASLAHILRQIQAMDDRPFIVTALDGSIGDMFLEMDDFQAVQQALGRSFTHMAALRSDLSARKAALQDQEQEQSDLLVIQVAQQNSLKITQQEKQDLVKQAKGHEAEYQRVLTAKQQTAAQIEAQLFALRDTKAVSFGDIFSYAREASAATHVRAAIILGILAEESNLGQNVGKGTWSIDMHPTRDVPVFRQITLALGLNPDVMPVSKKQWYGWGGAMGPAQFIPSTWQQYAPRIGQMSGQNPPNPWDPRTAAFAAAILMMDNGADAQTPAAERLAALRYLAGWKNANKSSYSFYGDDVMDLAAKFQGQINVLQG